MSVQPESRVASPNYPVHEPGPWFVVERLETMVEWSPVDEGQAHSTVAAAEAALAGLLNQGYAEPGDLRVSEPISAVWRARCLHCGTHADREDYYYEAWPLVVDVLSEENADAHDDGEHDRWQIGTPGKVWCRQCANSSA